MKENIEAEKSNAMDSNTDLHYQTEKEPSHKANISKATKKYNKYDESFPDNTMNSPCMIYKTNCSEDNLRQRMSDEKSLKNSVDVKIMSDSAMHYQSIKTLDAETVENIKNINDQLKNRLNKLSMKNTELSSNLIEKMVEFETFKLECESKKEVYKLENIKLTERVIKLERELKRYENTNDSINDSNKKTEMAMMALEESKVHVINLEQRLSELEHTIQQKNKECNSLEDFLLQKNEELLNTKEKIDMFEKENDDITFKLEKKESEISILHTKNNQIQSETIS